MSGHRRSVGGGSMSDLPDQAPAAMFGERLCLGYQSSGSITSRELPEEAWAKYRRERAAKLYKQRRAGK